MSKIKEFPVQLNVQRLHLFTNDYDTYVAFSVDDVEECVLAFTGESQQDIDAEENPFVEIPDSSPVSIVWRTDDIKDMRKHCPVFAKMELIKDDYGIYYWKVTTPAWAWALQNGRGFLCSTEH